MNNAQRKARLLAQYIKGGKILDMGASEGALHMALERFAHKPVTSVDFLGKPDVVADLNKRFPFPSSSVDTILASEIIEHLDAPLFFLLECKRILKRKGHLILTTPNALSLAEWQGYFTKENKLDYTGHIYSWHRKSLERLVKKAGFEIVVIEHISFFWKRNYLLRAIARLIPLLRPNLFFVLRKP